MSQIVHLQGCGQVRGVERCIGIPFFVSSYLGKNAYAGRPPRNDEFRKNRLIGRFLHSHFNKHWDSE